MTRFSLLKSTCLSATFVAAALSSPALAESSSHTCDNAMMHSAIAQVSATHATLLTSVLIDAAPADVWATLTNFETLSNWSTGNLQGIAGDIANGSDVTVTFMFGVDDAGNPVAHEIPHKLIFEDGEKIGWSDPLPAQVGGGRDNHIYAVEACGDKTLFTQSDEIVDNPYALNVIEQLQPSYRQFNAELKAEVEK